jgi:hypothetical protein
VLTDGQIETEGTLEGSVSAGPAGLTANGRQDELTFHFGITGGTDSFRNARGQLDWGGGETGFILSFALIG